MDSTWGLLAPIKAKAADMRYNFLPTLPAKRAAMTLLASGLLVSAVGCSSTSDNDTAGEAGYEAAQMRNYSYLSQETVENMHSQLIEYSAQLRVQKLGDDGGNMADGLRQRLTAQAINYKDALRSGINDEESTQRRQISAAMLGFTGDPAFAYVLAQRASNIDEHPAVRINATVGLFELGEAINQSPQRREVMFTLRQLMLPADSTSSLRVNCVTAYARAYSPELDDTLAPLLNALREDSDEDVRRQVLYELREIGDPSVVSEIAAEAEDGAEPQTRAAAALALGGIKHPKSVEALRNIAGDENAEVRMQAIYSLSEIADSTNRDLIIDVLINALYDTDVDVRRSAAKASERLDDARLVLPLASATSDRNDKVREAAINAMAVVVKKDTEREAYVLVNALDDPDQDVSNASFRALKKITDKNLARSSESWRDWFYVQYPDLNPETQYKDSPRPPWSGTGIGSTRRSSSSGSTRTSNRNFSRNTRRRR